jgi:hypothetical protein
MPARPRLSGDVTVGTLGVVKATELPFWYARRFGEIHEELRAGKVKEVDVARIMSEAIHVCLSDKSKTVEDVERACTVAEMYAALDEIAHIGRGEVKPGEAAGP